jgi:hypothetical protein
LSTFLSYTAAPTRVAPSSDGHGSTIGICACHRSDLI